MRQILPLSRGYPLVVNDIGRTIHPGEEFDAPLLVPGCEPVEDGTEEDERDADATGEAAASSDPQPAAEAAEDASAPPGESPAKPRATRGTRQ